MIRRSISNRRQRAGWHLARLHTYAGRKSTPTNLEGPPIRDKPLASSQQARSFTGLGAQPQEGDRSRHHAVRGRVHMERWKGLEGEYQRAINRMGRDTLGAFQSTPLAEESGLAPARALRNHRQAHFTPRGAATSRARPASRSIREHCTSRSIREHCRHRTSGGDGTRVGRRLSTKQWPCGGSVRQQDPSGWAGYPFHLGTNKEVFDAGAYAIYRALCILDR